LPISQWKIALEKRHAELSGGWVFCGETDSLRQRHIRLRLLAVSCSTARDTSRTCWRMLVAERRAGGMEDVVDDFCRKRAPQRVTVPTGKNRRVELGHGVTKRRACRIECQVIFWRGFAYPMQNASQSDWPVVGGIRTTVHARKVVMESAACACLRRWATGPGPLHMNEGHAAL